MKSLVPQSRSNYTVIITLKQDAPNFGNDPILCVRKRTNHTSQSSHSMTCNSEFLPSHVLAADNNVVTSFLLKFKMKIQHANISKSRLALLYHHTYSFIISSKPRTRVDIPWLTKNPLQSYLGAINLSILIVTIKNHHRTVVSYCCNLITFYFTT